MSQGDLFPEIPVSEKRQVVSRRMHNSKLYLSLLEQLNIMKNAEIEKITGTLTYKALSLVGLLPKVSTECGYFIKENAS